MDSPERSKAVAPPISKTEDSPFSTFINNLSPIHPVNSVHTLQTFQSLNFASMPSIFTSPHVNPPKDSRFLIRNLVSENTSIGNSEKAKVSNIEGCNIDFDKSSHCTTVASESCTAFTLVESAAELHGESSRIHNDLVQSEQYDCVSPNHNTNPCYATRHDRNICEGSNYQQHNLLVQDVLDNRKSLFSTENELQLNPDSDKVKEGISNCDWKSLISNEADGLMFFDSSTDPGNHEKQAQLLENQCISSCIPLAPMPAEDGSSSQAIQPDNDFDPFSENMKDPSENFHEDTLEKYEADHTPQILSTHFNNQTTASASSQNSGNEIDNCDSLACKVDLQQRGIRRRCLVFEASGVSKKNTQTDLSYRSSLILKHNKNAASDDTYLISRPGASLSPCAFPGIGLHLNALTSISKVALPPSRQLVAATRSCDPLHPACGEDFSQALATVDTPVIAANEFQDIQTDICDDSQALVSENCEDKSQNSPRKKRRTEDNEGDGCRRCSCKRSKCLKLYCECFASGVYCIEPCSCQGCFNKPLHEETVLATRKQIESRNPLAFAPKVIQVHVPVYENGEKNKTPASARHKRGCNCKKSSCLKKYCECFQAGVGCSVSCRCEGCKNAFGKKDGPMEFEQERDEVVACENGEQPVDNQHNDDSQMSREKHIENPIPVTPLLICRPSCKDVVSIGKPPRSTTLPGSCSRLNISQALTKCQILFPECKSSNHVTVDSEAETYEISRDKALLSNVVKTSSPNGKRVSSPHNGIGLSPHRKASRKLILRSIPSFPTLNSEASANDPFDTV